MLSGWSIVELRFLIETEMRGQCSIRSPWNSDLDRKGGSVDTLRNLEGSETQTEHRGFCSIESRMTSHPRELPRELFGSSSSGSRTHPPRFCTASSTGRRSVGSLSFGFSENLAFHRATRRRFPAGRTHAAPARGRVYFRTHCQGKLMTCELTSVVKCTGRIARVGGFRLSDARVADCGAHRREHCGRSHSC
jgi:hypothetical protein